jgi:chromate transport protein ChrA
MVGRNPDDGRVFIIIGGGAAGYAAAQTLREDGYTGRVLMITREERTPYDRPNLSKDYLHGHAEPEWMPLRPEEFFAEHDIEVAMGKDVTRVHAASKTISFGDGTSQTYDALLVATGGAPRKLSVPGSDLENVFVLRSFADADRIIEDEGSLTEAVPLVIDDDAPPPEHTLPSRARTLKILVLGLALWTLPLVVIVLWRGWGSLHAQEYRFFTQAALVTFGGAYAVLAYVTQAAAGSYGWMTRVQGVDGLALAETTPGPLIMVLQFIGFMAAWNNPQGMSRTASAVTGALVTTYVTFLPCFIFLFLGAPYIEKLRGNKNLTCALTGVTAAVVGVILNLALVFGAAVIWPKGLAGGADWFAAGMSVAAFIALYQLKADVLWVVLAGGVVGLGWAIFTAV